MRILGHKPTVTAWIGMGIIVVNLFIAIFGPAFAPYSESQSIGGTWDEPSMQMLLGADQIGRDMLTRLIYGARMTIGVALATTALSFFIGITLGFTAAVLGGWVDTIISRLVDVILSIPLLILALIILGVFGSSIPVLIITIAVLDSTRVFRLARALGMNLTGVGVDRVAPEEHEAVFQRFYRTASAQTMAIPGTGLGLPIVAGIGGNSGKCAAK